MRPVKGPGLTGINLNKGNQLLTACLVLTGRGKKRNYGEMKLSIIT